MRSTSLGSKGPSKPGLGFKPYFGKCGEYRVIKYFKSSDVQNCANLWIFRLCKTS